MLILCFLQLKGQESFQVDTLQVLSLNGIITSITFSGQDTICKVDGEVVSFAEFRNLKLKSSVPKTCKPCYIQVVDINNRLMEEGLYYVGNDKMIEKENLLPFIRSNSKKFQIINDSYYDGAVKYYNKNGKLKKIIFYDRGKKI